jgi:hypothetical protein
VGSASPRRPNAADTQIRRLEPEGAASRVRAAHPLRAMVRMSLAVTLGGPQPTAHKGIGLAIRPMVVISNRRQVRDGSDTGRSCD